MSKKLEKEWESFVSGENRYRTFHAFARNYIQNPELLDHLFKTILEVRQDATTSPRIRYDYANGTQFPKYMHLYLHSRKEMTMNENLAPYFRQHVKRNAKNNLPTTAALPQDAEDLVKFTEEIFGPNYALNHVILFISTRPGKWFPIHIARKSNETMVTCLTPDPLEEALITWLLRFFRQQGYKIRSTINNGFCPYGNIMEFIYDKGQGIDYCFDDYVGAIMIAQIAHLNTQRAAYRTLIMIGDNYHNLLRYYKFQLYVIFWEYFNVYSFSHTLRVAREDIEAIEKKMSGQLSLAFEKARTLVAIDLDAYKRLLSKLNPGDKYVSLKINPPSLDLLSQLYFIDDVCDYIKLYSLDNFTEHKFNRRLISRHINPANTFGLDDKWPGRK